MKEDQENIHEGGILFEPDTTQTFEVLKGLTVGDVSYWLSPDRGVLAIVTAGAYREIDTVNYVALWFNYSIEEPTITRGTRSLAAMADKLIGMKQVYLNERED